MLASKQTIGVLMYSLSLHVRMLNVLNFVFPVFDQRATSRQPLMFQNLKIVVAGLPRQI